jgi:Ca2+-binding RTX toxin-like protein
VNITINAVNDAPVASDDTYSATQNIKLTVAAPGVLGNDNDVELDPLTAILVSGPAHGTLTLSSDGSLVYTPNEDYIGSDTFTYKANDGSLDSNVATVHINVAAATAGASLIPDPCGTGTALLVQGTSGDDSILVNPSNTAGSYDVTLNGQLLGSYAVTRIIVHGEAGNDTIQVSGSVATPVWLFGDSGNDHLNAGNGGSVIVGGSGDDEILGGAGRDVLIGGLGADHLVGNADDDILVAGRTDYDRDLGSLCNILDQWLRTDANFATRVEQLKGTQAGGLNGSTYLNAGTVHDDGAVDQIDVLVGSSGDDWYVYDSASGDKANGVSSLEKTEAITNI